MSDQASDNQPSAEPHGTDDGPAPPVTNSPLLHAAIARGEVTPPTRHGQPELIPELADIPGSLADQLIADRREHDARRSGPYPPDDDQPTTDTAAAQAHALVDQLCGAPDEEATRAVEVLHAHAAALTWARTTTRTQPAPEHMSARLEAAAARLRSGEDNRDPARVLIETAAAALADDTSDTDQPTSPAPPTQPRPAGRLVLHNPGTPAIPLPDDIDLDQALARARPGGQILLHQRPGGAVLAALIPAGDPRLKLYQTGEQHLRRAPSAGDGRLADNYVENIETANFYLSPQHESTTRAHAG